MIRPWGATGVFALKAVKLSSDTKEQISQIIKDHKHPVLDPDAFFDELDNSLSRFDGTERSRLKSSPAHVRKNLAKAAKVSMDLNKLINDLDGNSHQLLDEAVEGGLKGFRVHLSYVVLGLREARRLSDEYPKRGRLHAPHRIYLARDIADAIEQFIQVSPTATRGGLFVSILESVCDQAFGKIDADVFELARKALSYPVKIRYADGSVEYCPPPNDD